MSHQPQAAHEGASLVLQQGEQTVLAYCQQFLTTLVHPSSKRTRKLRTVQSGLPHRSAQPPATSAAARFDLDKLLRAGVARWEDVQLLRQVCSASIMLPSTCSRLTSCPYVRFERASWPYPRQTCIELN